jgi:hypothetical protein
MDTTGAADITGLQYDAEFYTLPPAPGAPDWVNAPAAIRKTLINMSAFVLTMKHLAANAAAVGTLTLSANVADNDAVTIAAPAQFGGTRIYTFKTALTAGGGYPGEVLIGGSASVSIDNLIFAINNTGTPGTNYGTGTAINIAVSAAAGAGDTMDVTATDAGAVGNTIGTTETSATASWGAATLTGGTGPLSKNRMVIAGGDFAVPPNGSFDVEYDFDLAGWRAV